MIDTPLESSRRAASKCQGLYRSVRGSRGASGLDAIGSLGWSTRPAPRCLGLAPALALPLVWSSNTHRIDRPDRLARRQVHSGPVGARRAVAQHIETLQVQRSARSWPAAINPSIWSQVRGGH